MRDEDVDKLFDKAAAIGFKYGIDLLGDESIVAMRSFKLSDTEHIIHELAHAALWGLDISDEGVIRELEQQEHDEHESHVNEIESFAVTMEVFKRLGAADEVDELAFFNSLAIAIHGYESSDRKDAPHLYDLRAFHATERGKSVVESILKLFEEI